MNTVKNGKGDEPRKVDKKKFDENYDRIFKKQSNNSEELKTSEIKKD